MKHIIISAKIVRPIIHLLNRFKDVGDLLIRFWIAQIFFLSGLSKITDWDTTLVLFKYVYTVPLLNPALAAYIGTAAELIFPILIVIGFGGRFFLFCFFMYNLICALSFSFLWTPAGTAGLDDHINWGLLLMFLMFHGMGRISLDYFIHKRYGHLIVYSHEKIKHGISYE
jgi:putative oxidoreductase